MERRARAGEAATSATTNEAAITTPLDPAERGKEADHFCRGFRPVIAHERADLRVDPLDPRVASPRARFAAEAAAAHQRRRPLLPGMTVVPRLLGGFGRAATDRRLFGVVGRAALHRTVHRPLLAQRARMFGATPPRLHGEFEMQDPSDPADIVRLNIVSRDGSRHQINGKVGDNLMYLAHRYQDENPHILLEGACEGSVACATCHVVVDETHFDDLPEPSEDEEDMLDTAPGLQPTSRLGCQIILTREMDGMEITLPMHSVNFYVDGHVPVPH